MYHRSTSIIAALGLSAVLLGASPASAGTAHRIDGGETVDYVPVVDATETAIMSLRVAERGYQVRKTTPRTDKDDTPIVSPRVAERGYQVHKTTPRTDKDDTPIVSPRVAERGSGESQVWTYTEDGTDRQVRVVPRNTPLAW